MTYTGNSSSVTIWVFLSFVYAFGYYEFPIFLGTDSDWGFDLLNLNWWIDPNEIARTLNFLTDADFYIQAFATFLYGGAYGRSNLDMSGLLFVVAGILSLTGILIGMRTSRISGVIIIAAGLISILAVFLGWQNAINQTTIGGLVDSNFLMIPVGNLVLLAGGLLNFRES